MAKGKRSRRVEPTVRPTGTEIADGNRRCGHKPTLDDYALRFTDGRYLANLLGADPADLGQRFTSGRGKGA